MDELKAMTVLNAYQLECNDDDLVYRKSEADKVITELKEKVEELTGEIRRARPTFKCAECGEVGPHKWVWNGKDGPDFVVRRCCAKCIKEKGLTLWPRDHSCEEKCTEFNALKDALRWRKCSEELPKYDEYVFAFCPDYGSVEKARLLEDDEWRDSDWNFLEVTHWMPLPKPPEGK